MKVFILLGLILFSNLAVASNEVNNLIVPVQYFVNHQKDILELSQNLEKYNKASLIGISGIGKTQIARVYAYQNQAKYKVIWFFDSGIDINSQFSFLAKEINKNMLMKDESKLSVDYKNAKNDVMHYLSFQNDWLLVFDNLRINQNHKLQEIITWENNGHIIFCSQDNKDLPQNIMITLLNEGSSMKLITDIIEHKRKLDDVMQLNKSLNGNPALIMQAATFLKENRYVNVAEYMKHINKSHNRIRNHVELVFPVLDYGAQKLFRKIASINNHKFSFNILKIIENEDDIIMNLNMLIRFGLISDISKGESIMFEMHDSLKDAVLEITDININKENINDILDKINSVIPEGIFTKYFEMLQEETLKANLEILLSNAERYKADIHKIMELRQNLMNYYLTTFDYYSCQKMEEWFFEQKNSKAINTNSMNEKEKAVFTWYLTNIALYEDFAKSNVFKSIELLKEAKLIAEQLKENEKLKFTILCFLAEMYSYAGDTNKAVDSIIQAEAFMKDNANLDNAMYDWVKARISINQGRYEDALAFIKKNIEANKIIDSSTVSTPAYVIECEILNYLGRYKESYEIAKRLYKKERDNIKEDHEIHASILVQISRAENGMGAHKDALLHAAEAKEIYTKDKNRKNKNLLESEDIDLALSYVAEGDSLADLEKYELALESYAVAETIFYNRYRDNMRHMDCISYLYFKGSFAASKLEDSFWYKKFSTQLIQKFGKDHFRVKMLLKKQ